jgi:hypothetical protein
MPSPGFSSGYISTPHLLGRLLYPPTKGENHLQKDILETKQKGKSVELKQPLLSKQLKKNRRVKVLN